MECFVCDVTPNCVTPTQLCVRRARGFEAPTRGTRSAQHQHRGLLVCLVGWWVCMGRAKGPAPYALRVLGLWACGVQ